MHRLWEPIEAKRRVPNGYVAKFSSPYCIAVGFLDGSVREIRRPRAHK